MLRPADGVGERGGPFAPAVAHDRLGDLQPRLLRRPAHALDHLRRVASEVPAQDVEDAARVLQRRIRHDASVAVSFEGPSRHVVAAILRVVSGKKTVEVLCATIRFVDDVRCVGIDGDVLLKVQVVR